MIAFGYYRQIINKHFPPIDPRNPCDSLYVYILPIVYFGSGEALISNNTLCLASSGPTSILGHDKVSRQPSG